MKTYALNIRGEKIYKDAIVRIPDGKFGWTVGFGRGSGKIQAIVKMPTLETTNLLTFDVDELKPLFPLELKI
jgi:hypothetical protein